MNSAAAIAVALETSAGSECQAGTQRAARDWPAPLDGMVLIGPGVHDVVDEVGARCNDAEHHEGADDADGRVPVAQDACGGGCHEHEQVLGPLPRAHPPHERAHGRAEAGRREVVQLRRVWPGRCLVGGHPFDRRHGATADMVMKSRAHHDWKYRPGVPVIPGSSSVPLVGVAGPLRVDGA